MELKKSDAHTLGEWNRLLEDAARLDRLQDEPMPLEIDVFSFPEKPEDNRTFLTLRDGMGENPDTRFSGKDVRDAIDSLRLNKPDAPVEKRDPTPDELAKITKRMMVALPDIHTTCVHCGGDFLVTDFRVAKP